MMARDSSRAFYGPGHVQAAHELGAVQTLLITDTLFRVNNVAQVHQRHDCNTTVKHVAFLVSVHECSGSGQVEMHACHATR